MPLQGNLKEMSLANLIQINCQEMRTARLTLAHQGKTASIFFSDGQVVHAENESSSGEQVIYQSLSWDDGTFTLDTDVPPPERTIQTAWPVLLLEGMKRAAEWQKEIDRAVDSLSPEVKKSPDMLNQLKAIDGVAGAVIASSDGVVQSTDISDSDGEREAAVAVFVGGAARQIGDLLQLGKFQHGIVFWKNRRVLVLETPDRYFGLVLGEHGSPALVASATMRILGA